MTFLWFVIALALFGTGTLLIDAIWAIKMHHDWVYLIIWCVFVPLWYFPIKMISFLGKKSQ